MTLPQIREQLISLLMIPHRLTLLKEALISHSVDQKIKFKLMKETSILFLEDQRIKLLLMKEALILLLVDQKIKLLPMKAISVFNSVIQTQP